jgi:hypothetical protein
VARLFGEVTERCVRRGSHTAVRAFEKGMLDYLDRRNEIPSPSSGLPMPMWFSAKSPDFRSVLLAQDSGLQCGCALAE